MAYTKAQKAAYAKKMNKKKRPFNKKVTKQKQAYRPKQKKQFRMKRQPFVETKKAIDIHYVDDVMNPLVLAEQPAAQYRTFRNKQISPIDSFLFMNRGVGNDKIIGRDIYSKYLKQKIEIQLPAGVIPDTTTPAGNTNRPFCRITQPCQIWVVWGWIKKPFGSRLTSGGAAVTMQDVLNEIDYITTNGEALLGKVASRGVANSDYLTFPEKRKNLWTMNKRLLKSGHTKSSVDTPEGYLWQHTSTTATQQAVSNRTADFGDVNAYTGYPNVLQTTIEWETNRKMRYEAIDGDTTQGDAFARDTWLPYSYICIPKQFQDAVNKASPAVYRYPVDPAQTATHNYYDLVGEMKVSASMCHWFSDS